MSQEIECIWKAKQYMITGESNDQIYRTIINHCNIKGDVVIYLDQEQCKKKDTIGWMKQKAEQLGKYLLFYVKSIEDLAEEIEKQAKEIVDLKVKVQQHEQTQSFLNDQISKLNEDLQSMSQIIQKQKQQMANLQKQQPYSKKTSLEKNKIDNFVESCIISDEIRNFDSQELIQHLIHKKSEELNTLETSRSQLLSCSQSMAIDQSHTCHFCNFDIYEDIIQLSCQHSFHDQCFDQMLQAQISLECPYFTCLCCKKLKPNDLFCLSNKDAAEIHRLRMLQSQIRRIRETNFGFMKCPNKYCTFFYRVDQRFGNQSYCPSCLQ